MGMLTESQIRKQTEQTNLHLQQLVAEQQHTNTLLAQLVQAAGQQPAPAPR